MNQLLRRGILVATVCLTPLPAFAGPGHDHATKKEGAHTPSGETLHQLSLADTVVAIEEIAARISAAATAKQLSQMHDLTEELDHAASHLSEKAPAEQRARVSGMAANITGIGAKLHQEADRNDQGAVERSVARLLSVIAVLRGQVGMPEQPK